MMARPRRRLPRRRFDSAAVSAGLDSAALLEARRVFERELSREVQLQVAQEIVVTRATELRLAYPNVVQVTFGHRRMQDSRARRYRVVPTPCVRFLVACKWSESNGERDTCHIQGAHVA